MNATRPPVGRPPVPGVRYYLRCVGFVILYFAVGCTLAVGTATAVLWLMAKVMGA